MSKGKSFSYPTADEPAALTDFKGRMACLIGAAGGDAKACLASGWVGTCSPNTNCPGLVDKKKCKIDIVTCNIEYSDIEYIKAMKRCKKKCKKDKKKKKRCQKTCCELGFPV